MIHAHHRTTGSTLSRLCVLCLLRGEWPVVASEPGITSSQSYLQEGENNPCESTIHQLNAGEVAGAVRGAPEDAKDKVMMAKVCRECCRHEYEIDRT